jgi:hypothetical protein
MSNEIVVPNANAGAMAIPDAWQQKLAAYAQETQHNEAMGGQFFSTRGGILTFAGQPIANNTMDVVIAGSMFENVFYPERFDSDKIKAPKCYAYSLDGNNMVPHQKVAEPQSEACGTCQWGKWESAKVLGTSNSKAKACKNMRRLGCLPLSSLADPEAIEKGTVGYLRIPVTSVKFWSGYAQRLAASGVPPFACITRITLKPDPKTQIRIEFELVKIITDEAQLEALHKRFQAEKVAIAFPYPEREEGDDVPPPPPGAAPTPAPAAPSKAKKF